jgi:hypothetical protein
MRVNNHPSLTEFPVGESINLTNFAGIDSYDAQS